MEPGRSCNRFLCESARNTSLERILYYCVWSVLMTKVGYLEA